MAARPFCKKIVHTLFYVSNYYKEVLVVAANKEVGLIARGAGDRDIEVIFFQIWGIELKYKFKI
jgi:hypothetical protein